MPYADRLWSTDGCARGLAPGVTLPPGAVGLARAGLLGVASLTDGLRLVIGR